MASKQGRGPLRLMADEVEQTLLPTLASSGLSLDEEAPHQGKWDRTGYEWYLKFDDPAYDDLRCEIMVRRKKSTIVVIRLVSEVRPAQWQSWFHYNLGTAATDAHAGTNWQRELSSLPLSRIGQSLFLADNLPGLWKLKYEDRLWLRLLIWVGTLPWTIFALLGLLLTLPILGTRQRGEASPAVQSGQRQRHIALRMARDMNALFRSGVPLWLFQPARD